MRERDIEKYLSSELRKIGIECVKFIPDQRNGMPDRLVLLPDGRCIWVELKCEQGRVSPIQQYMHEWLRGIGQKVYVVWNKPSVCELIEEIKKGQSVQSD